MLSKHSKEFFDFLFTLPQPVLNKNLTNFLASYFNPKAISRQKIDSKINLNHNTSVKFYSFCGVDFITHFATFCCLN